MDKTINKLDLTKDVADLVNMPQSTVKKITDSIWEVIKQNLADGGQISIPGFGNFSVKDRAARIGRNPKTGAQIQIEATKIPTFKASKLLKDLINKN